MAKGEAYYRGVRGSAALPTARLAAGEVAAEALAPGELRRLPFHGQLLGAARVRASFAPIPLVAFDRAGERLEAEAQAAWLHLIRLSWGEGRNWARVGKRELMARLRLSERRLLRVLDALVAGGFATPLHRDNRGTLWQVAWPGRAVRRAARRRGAAGPGQPGAGPRRAAGRPRAGPGRASRPGRPARPGARRGARERELARALVEARGLRGEAAEAAALREVQELVDEGQGYERIAAAIAAVARRTARGAGEQAMKVAIGKVAVQQQEAVEATRVGAGAGPTRSRRCASGCPGARPGSTWSSTSSPTTCARSARRSATSSATCRGSSGRWPTRASRRSSSSSLALGGGPADQLDYLGEMLANTRRRLAQVAARM